MIKISPSQIIIFSDAVKIDPIISDPGRRWHRKKSGRVGGKGRIRLQQEIELEAQTIKLQKPVTELWKLWTLDSMNSINSIVSMDYMVSVNSMDSMKSTGYELAPF